MTISSDVVDEKHVSDIVNDFMVLISLCSVTKFEVTAALIAIYGNMYAEASKELRPTIHHLFIESIKGIEATVDAKTKC